MKNIPYTYVLKNKTTGKIYYGCQYSNTCDPSNFWVTYFTSSTYVRDLISQYGKDDFEFEIRKTFKTKSQALAWERKVLRRLKAASRDIFINKNNGGLTSYANQRWINNSVDNMFVDEYSLSEYTKAGWVTGRLFSESHCLKISKGVNDFYDINRHPRKGLPASQKMLNHLASIRSNKSKSLAVLIDGIQYPSIKDAIKKTKLSRYHIRQIIRDPNYIKPNSK